MTPTDSDEPRCCGSCPAFLTDPESVALGRCFGCRQPPAQMRVDAPAETYWSINAARDAELAAVNGRYDAGVAALRAACPHEKVMGWLQDGGTWNRCWHRCCARCFKTLETVYARPEGAIG